MFSIRNLIAIAGTLIFIMTAGQAAAISYTNDACVFYPVESYGGTTNDTVMDASTNAQDGIADGLVFPLGTTPGLNGNSAIFPGGADIYVAGEMPPSGDRFQNDTLLLSTNDYTIMMWVRATDAYNVLNGPDGKVWTTSSGLFDLFLNQNGSIVYTVTNDTAAMVSTSSAGVPVDSEWYHVAVVVNRDNLGSNPSAIYLDSSDVTGANTMEDTPTALDPAATDFWQWGRALTGHGDDFSIFKQALSQADIIELNGFAPTTSTTTSSTSTTLDYNSACVWYPVEYYTNVVPSTVTVLDQSGNNQDGAGGGNIFTAGQPIAGINGNSAVFPGGGDIHVAGETPPSGSRFFNQTLALETNDFTVVMWVRSTGAYFGGGPNGLTFRPAHYRIYLSKAGTIELEVPGDSAVMATASGTAIPTDNEWYHVAVVVNRDNANGNPSAIYVNSGNLTSNPMEDTPTSLSAGNSLDAWGRSLQGQGDDFAIFKEALSQAQIVALTGVTSTSTTSTTSTFSTTSSTSTFSTTTSTSTQSSTTSSTSTTSPYSQACLYYPLESFGGTQIDTVPDESGEDQDGIADGAVFPLGTSPGINGNSANFPASDIYIAGEVPPSGSRFRNQTLGLGTNDYTIMMWVRATDAFHPGIPDGLVATATSGLFDLFLSRTNRIEYVVSPDGAKMRSQDGCAVPVDMEWYHVAVTVNRDNLGGNPSAIYVNSANATADNMEDTPTAFDPAAGDFWQFGRSLRGQGDDFAFFKEALSLAEITAINGLTSTTTSSTSSTITSTTSTSSSTTFSTTTSSTTFSTTTSSTSTTSTTSTTSPFIDYEEDACLYYPVEAYGGTQTDTVQDATANGQDGIADGDVFPLGTSPGINGNSANFPVSASDIYIAGEVPPSGFRFRNQTLALGTNDYTIMMWVRATGAYFEGPGVTNGVAATTTSGLFDLFLSSSGTIEYVVNPDSAKMSSTNGANIPVDSEWYHVAVVVNRDNSGDEPSAIYVNGFDVTGTDTMEDTPTPFDPAGGDLWQWGRAFSGQGDDFAIFKKSLSGNEVRSLAGFQLVSPGTILIIR